MKKLLIILTLFLILGGVANSEYCDTNKKLESLPSHTAQSYAIHLGDYYQPEESYKFGLEIQDAVKNKDLKKLLSLIRNDLISGPEMRFFKNKKFEDVFTEEFRNLILEVKPSCAPVGTYKGFSLGRGMIWYDRVPYTMFDLQKDLNKKEWFSKLSRIDQITLVRDFKTIYGPWTITKITSTK